MLALPAVTGVAAIVNSLVNERNYPVYDGVILELDQPDTTMTVRTYLRQFVDANGGNFERQL